MTAREAKADENRRQALYWRPLARLFDPEEHASLEAVSVAVVDDLGLPAALLDPSVSVDALVQRFPELAADFDGLLPSPDAAADGTPSPLESGGEDGREQVRRAALVSKLLLNVFATKPGSITAAQLSDWQRDAGWLRRALGDDGGDRRAISRAGPYLAHQRRRQCRLCRRAAVPGAAGRSLRAGRHQRQRLGAGDPHARAPFPLPAPVRRWLGALLARYARRAAGADHPHRLRCRHARQMGGALQHHGAFRIGRRELVRGLLISAKSGGLAGPASGGRTPARTLCLPDEPPGGTG